MGLFKNIFKVVAAPIRAIAGSGNRGPSGADAALPYLQQIASMAQNNAQPGIARGRQAVDINLPELYRRTHQLYDTSEGEKFRQNPSAYLDEIYSKYNPSEGYRFKSERLLSQARNAAAAGGFAGTPSDQEQQAALVRELLGEDMQEYLSNVLGIQTNRERQIEREIGGERELAGIGADTTADLTNTLGTNLSEIASLAYNSAEGARNRRQARNNALLNFIGQGIGAGTGAFANGGMFGHGGRFGPKNTTVFGPNRKLITPYRL